ncbi:MAG: hypothetical protein ABI411_15220 [Tahibacter sp.]
MSQNLVSLTLSDVELQAVDQAIATLESTLGGLVSLTTGQRRSFAKMGSKSETFCRQTLGALEMNPSLHPTSLGIDEGINDLRVLDQMRPRFRRLARLSERSADTEFALGSDVMHTALLGYAQLKLTGKHQGLEGLRKTLSMRFSKSGGTVEVEPLPQAA